MICSRSTHRRRQGQSWRLVPDQRSRNGLGLALAFGSDPRLSAATSFCFPPTCVPLAPDNREPCQALSEVKVKRDQSTRPLATQGVSPLLRLTLGARMKENVLLVDD